MCDCIYKMNFRSLYYLVIFIVCLNSYRVQSYSVINCINDEHPEWLCNYMEKHKKNYSGKAEAILRKKKLMEMQPYDGPVKFGFTSRSDRFQHELKRNVPLKLKNHENIDRKSSIKHLTRNSYGLPPIDWRNYNGVPYVTEVKDQGDCGDCFAFSSATVLEFWSKRNGYPKSLSTQTIMDCTSGPKRPDVGCEGGLMEYVFEYAKRRPITLESEYPYKEIQKSCPRKRLMSHVNVNSYKVLMQSETPQAEKDFEYILHNFGPIAVGIDSTNMDNYKGGIFTADICGKDIDHAVAIVGYTEDAWIIKNSWGPNWGDKGYMYLERGKNACGIAEYAVYVDSAHATHRKLSTVWHMDAF